MKTLFLFIFILFSIFCSSQSKISIDNQNYLRHVGDIEQNDQLDRAEFNVCHGDDKVFQYFNLGEGPVYPGEKLKIVNIFKSTFLPNPISTESGLIRIRFIVNCEGKAGRFRVIQSDEDYQEKEFDAELVSQLLKITKEIKKWEIIYKNQIPVDYYIYLIFKIKDGQIVEILP